MKLESNEIPKFAKIYSKTTKTVKSNHLYVGSS